MNTLNYRYLRLLLAFYIGLARCHANSPTAIMQSDHQPSRPDSTSGRVLTITRVKTPWYAPRFLVVRGFRKSIPEYQQINGLTRKAYVLTDNRAYFGGIYLWQSKTDAQKWFNDAWFARVLKTYGEAGVVDYYSVIQTTDVAILPASEGNYWTVLSLSGNVLAISVDAPGLLRMIEIRATNGQTGFVTFWQTKAGADAFMENNLATHTRFDTPIFLDNVPENQSHAVSVSR